MQYNDGYELIPYATAALFFGFQTNSRKKFTSSAEAELGYSINAKGISKLTFGFNLTIGSFLRK